MPPRVGAQRGRSPVQLVAQRPGLLQTSGLGPRARTTGLAARASRHRLRADPSLRPLDRVSLAGHPPADLQGAAPDGDRRLGQPGCGEARSTVRLSTVTTPGRAALATWISDKTVPATSRSEVAVKMRGASYGDRGQLLAHLEELIAEHRTRQEHFEQLEREQFPEPTVLPDQRLETWLVLRGGIKQEQFWVEWLSEYADAWRGGFASFCPAAQLIRPRPLRGSRCPRSSGSARSPRSTRSPRLGSGSRRTRRAAG